MGGTERSGLEATTRQALREHAGARGTGKMEKTRESFAVWLRWSRTDEILALLEMIKAELGHRGQTLRYEIGQRSPESP
jgi:hypothetical protein